MPLFAALDHGRVRMRSACELASLFFNRTSEKIWSDKATEEEMSLEAITRVVKINANSEGSCQCCSKRIGGSHLFAESINHYLKDHGYKLLHIGSEATEDRHGEPCHMTVAMLGTE